MASVPGIDPPAWPQVFGPDDWSTWSGATTPMDGLDALAALVELRWSHLRERSRAEADLVHRPLVEPALVVGIAGPVACGKSTIASTLADRLRRREPPIVTEVLSTDGFLRSNADLEADGLTLRKGFPESYDLGALRSMHRSLHLGEPEIATPVYSHDTYDLADEMRRFNRPQVLVLEGVNALQGAPDGAPGPGDLADLAIYIDVAEDLAIKWFTERFVQWTDAARSDPSSFYSLWASMSDDDVRQSARDVWDGINGVNLRDHIEPSRRRADVEIVKAADHEVTELRLHR